VAGAACADTTAERHRANRLISYVTRVRFGALMHRPVVAATALTILALAAPAAHAATTTATPPSTGAPSSTTAPSTTAPPTTAPVPAPAPAKGTMTLTLEKVNGKSAAVLDGQRFRVRGTVKPYVAGQKVVVRFYRGSKKLSSKSVTVKGKAGASTGSFVLGFTAKKAGHITVRASHRATAQLTTLVAKGKGVDVLPLRAAAGSKGLAVRILQTKLKALGYVIGQKGVYDARTARAVLAFRKVTGMARTESADESVFRKLAHGAGAYKVKFPKQGHHVEADLSLQVLALIDGSKVERIYPISSGKPSTPTVLGTFRVYSKTPGTNAKGMVYTSYFHGGYGIHGYAEVPTFAASHGCLRTPVPDAIPIFDWIKYGDYVDVYN
jgi:peptidoglycan hydrolase-like protein with peptidoglycan-binding domain